ncbi:hypothetical protein [Bartonella tamiae]|uniref:Uncharacterized protein n=1 Tax=Bartonella tamiae Th239 TaxID=1094558 RepID=J0R0A1_9HYPH|nr:hypothetical protein [Bartonella tamiae]EJF88904.1 hypothetical protein ME5_01455 [Bartonella tamiae Th239]EJF94846.1 hypothetical protein MEG_00427 [Bartonella tamiae Th307]
MELNLQDKVYIVTCGGSGIGGAITRHLADEKATVVIIGRSPLNDVFIKDLNRRDARYSFINLI